MLVLPDYVQRKLRVALEEKKRTMLRTDFLCSVARIEKISKGSYLWKQKDHRPFVNFLVVERSQTFTEPDIFQELSAPLAVVRL